MKPMECLSLDLKRAVPSRRENAYLLVVIDECSCFPFAFPCKDMTASTVICCIDEIFTLRGTASFIHSDNGHAFTASEFKRYLLQRGIASNHGRRKDFFQVGH